jgi:signal peptidase I
MNDEGKWKMKEILEWVYCIIIAIVLALIVRYFIGTPTIVQQPSMWPTLKSGQRLILNRTIRTTKSTPERGDIITFEAPSQSSISAIEADFDNPVAVYNYNINNIFSKFRYYVLEIGKTSYIKRVIGLPGEHVKIENGKVYINGEELDEPYLQDNVTTESKGGVFTDIVVPENCVFVMGDNRSQSTDSRKFGCIPIEKIEGKVWIRFWPFNLFGKVE